MIGCSPLELHQDLEPETTALRISPMVFRRSCSGEIARFFSARPGERMGGCVAAERGPKSTRQPAAYACVLTVYPKNDPCEPAVICFSRNQMAYLRHPPVSKDRRLLEQQSLLLFPRRIAVCKNY